MSEREARRARRRATSWRSTSSTRSIPSARTASRAMCSRARSAPRRSRGRRASRRRSSRSRGWRTTAPGLRFGARRMPRSHGLAPVRFRLDRRRSPDPRGRSAALPCRTPRGCAIARLVAGAPEPLGGWGRGGAGGGGGAGPGLLPRRPRAPSRRTSWGWRSAAPVFHDAAGDMSGAFGGEVVLGVTSDSLDGG